MLNRDYQSIKNPYSMCDSAIWLKLTLMFHLIMYDSMIINDAKSLWEKNNISLFSIQDLGIIIAIYLIIF